jgi:demethylmenaquinone methyltransferase/2-methoxy-6-polyprenyl-1,4-benzoquinol methylase
MYRIEIPTSFVDKAKFVRAIFTRVEEEYDFLVRLMTLTLDSTWRNRMLSKMDFSKEVKGLDLACGTGLVTFDLARRGKTRSIYVGLDLSPAMLTIALKNKTRVPANCEVEFVRAAGELLPFREGSFDYITIGLALRNFADKLAMFKESVRVLVNSGWFLSVDFVRPNNPVVWFFYRFHIFHVLPTLGRFVSSHWKRTLIYLAKSIQLSAPPTETCESLSEAGFRETFVERMSLGIVALIGAHK